MNPDRVIYCPPWFLPLPFLILPFIVSFPVIGLLIAVKVKKDDVFLLTDALHKQNADALAYN